MDYLMQNKTMKSSFVINKSHIPTFVGSFIYMV